MLRKIASSAFYSAAVVFIIVAIAESLQPHAGHSGLFMGLGGAALFLGMAFDPHFDIRSKA